MTYEKVLATNRQAGFNYFILDRMEAGIVLLGTEVKSLRLGLCNLKDSYARCVGGEVWLYNCHIGPYPHGNRMNHEPLRPRKLLLHRNQILRLDRDSTKGTTLVPLKIYIRDRRIKVELGIGKGKKHYDKRASIREKDLDREARAAVRGGRR
jgi:SsrA-binding protein